MKKTMLAVVLLANLLALNANAERRMRIPEPWPPHSSHPTGSMRMLVIKTALRTLPLLWL